MSQGYNAKNIESKWYDYWLEHNYFHSEPDEREAFSIVIPPPNVTGVLHMGHMLNNTIQDILIRKARLDGKNACWVPGTDHASIATQAKVMKKLNAQGIKKSDLTREEFMEHAFAWKEEYGGIILDQLKRLGASCDWERTRFTMEPKLSDAVTKAFVDLHKKGKIYRGLRMTNWDPEAQTVLSNEEVIHKDENSRLYHVRYKIEGTDDEYVTIATVRPETILGDSAIAVNPKDERFAHLKGKRAIVPMVERSIPIIFDRYVEIEFGTGCLKVTPAHDMNDYEIGQRHDLEVIDVLNADGTMAEAAGFYVGEDRFKARKMIVKDLEAAGDLVKIEDYRNSVGRSERTDAVVEPRLTEQWFLSMKDFAATALKAVEEKEVTFFPEHFWNMYYQWLKEDNVRDWCISRQLWWGHRIPAWYCGDEIFVAETAEEALTQAKEKTGNADLTLADMRQDEDALDTWFSSWLWPISVFDGFETQEELAYYYPTSVLVTGWDIMFFWVARMIMAGYEFAPGLLGEDFIKKNGAQPFNDVYFTGMVRDEKKRKMSKSLGNSPDALALIDEYGADGVRFGMMLSGSAGNDIIFDAPIDPKTKKALNESQLCEQGRNFCNKMWNGLGFLQGKELFDAPLREIDKLGIEWIHARINAVLAEMNNQIETYRLGDALMSLYKLIRNDFFSWYLELIKPEYKKPMNRATYEATMEIYSKLMTMLHPFMPFVTEEIWHQLKEREAGDDCIVSTWPQAESYDESLPAIMEKIQNIVTKTKKTRSEKGISSNDALRLFVEDGKGAQAIFAVPGLKEAARQMGNFSEFAIAEGEVENGFAIVSDTEKYFLELNLEIDTEAERAKIEEDLKRQEGFLIGVRKKLGNERFVQNAPAAVLEREKKKLADGEARIAALKESLAAL